MSNIDYIKYTPFRKKEFSLKTIIENVDGKKIVKKASTNLESNAFIKRIFDNYQLLKKSYVNIEICKVYQNQAEDEILFEFIEGHTLTDILIDFINKNDKKSFIDLIYEYKSLILDKNRIQTKKAFSVTNKFIEIFGQYEGIFPFDYMSITNIDMSFDNIIINNDDYYIIDYEWIFTFPIPFKYVIYRNINYLYTILGSQIEIKKFISLNELFNLYEIYDDDICTFQVMEKNFNKYVFGDNFSINSKFLKSNYNLNQINEYKYHNLQNFYSQLFWDYGEGYEEKNSIAKNITISNKNTIEINYKVENLKIKNLRFDPLNENCIIELIDAKILHKDNEEQALKANFSNAFHVDLNKYYFSTDDPNIHFTIDSDVNITEVKFQLRYISYDSRTINLIEEKIISENTKNEMKISELQNQFISAVESRDHFLSLYNDVINSKFWRATKPFRIAIEKIKKIINIKKIS